jgi:hypothetical protein
MSRAVQQPATGAAEPRPAQPAGQHLGARRLVVYPHTDLLYWWVVWVYGFFCAIITRVGGVEVRFHADKAVKVYPDAWLGISFVGLVLFVLVFTHARARGVKSLILFLVLVVAVLSIQIFYGWNELLIYVPLLLVFMNQAFYVLFSSVLLVAWLFTTFVSDRLTYYEFTPGAISKRVTLSEGSENFTSPHVETKRQSDDVFVHRVLGLWFLGFGTGDLEIRFSTPGGGQRLYILPNVWRVARVERTIKALV